jgi:hypothetical protein
LVPSIWLFKFASRFYFGRHNWKKSLQKVHYTLYQNDFSFVDFGSPTTTKGNSFASNDALIDSTILYPLP